MESVQEAESKPSESDLGTELTYEETLMGLCEGEVDLVSPVTVKLIKGESLCTMIR